MELVGDNLWATTQDFTGDTSPRFKVDRFGDWNENYPTADFTVGQGEYYITFNDQSKVVTAELTENLIWDNAYFRGTPNSWAATHLWHRSAILSGKPPRTLTGKATPGLRLTGSAIGLKTTQRETLWCPVVV
jgi:hypothetical protein